MHKLFKVIWWTSLPQYPARLLTTHSIAKLISLSPLYCLSEFVFVNRLHLINSNMNVVYVWLAGWLPETPCLKALSVLSSRCTLRPPVCLPGWPTLASTICAVLNTFCHRHTAHWWSLSDSMSRSLFIFQPASLNRSHAFRAEFCRYFFYSFFYFFFCRVRGYWLFIYLFWYNVYQNRISLETDSCSCL